MTGIEAGQVVTDSMFDCELRVVDVTEDVIVVRSEYVDDYFLDGREKKCDSWYPHNMWDRNVAAGRFKPESGETALIDLGNETTGEETATGAATNGTGETGGDGDGGGDGGHEPTTNGGNEHDGGGEEVGHDDDEDVSRETEGKVVKSDDDDNHDEEDQVKLFSSDEEGDSGSDPLKW